MKRLALALLLTTAVVAQERKQLSLEALYDPKTMTRFGGAIQNDFSWISETAFVYPRRNANAKFLEWRLFDVATGKERPFFDLARVPKNIAAAIDEDVEFDDAKRAIVVTIDDDLWYYALGRDTATRLTNAKGEEEEATFSPDGKQVAFVRNNNLFVVDLTGRERQLTTDGGKNILNGKLDYVYQEEVYGRGVFKGYWWSPDSARIAFLRLDETEVPEFTIVDHIPYHLDLKVFHYPKAGDPNPRVSLRIVNAAGGEIVTVDNRRYDKGDFLIVDVSWGGNGLTYQVQDREQTWLELNMATTAGASRMLLRETTQAWVELLAAPKWLPDGTFLWQSERTGWRHLYHYRPDGTLVRPVTSGNWEVRKVHGVEGQHVYFSGTERTSLGLDVYRIRLDGTGLQRLSSAEGTHTATFSPRFGHYVDKWSDIRTPDQIRVHRSDGRVAHVVEANAVNAGFAVLEPQFLQVPTRDGVMLDAVMYKPANFDPSKKYPVYQLLYGGPHAPRVTNRWSGQGLQSTLFLQLIAQQGVIAWIVDNRTASGKGAVSAWGAYKNLGASELRDYEDAIGWLKSQPYVDGSRVCLFGWSYGGFMVAYALTHSKAFSAGISGAPVTDWRDYDTIYTERLMLTPQNNPEGYRRSSPRFDAANLHGNLLLIHGTTDDNVHVQNTLQFAYELQEAGREFEMMLYPRTKHGVRDEETLYHIQKTVLSFVRRRLLQ